MLKTQQQRYKQPIIAKLLNVEQNKSRNSSRSRDIIKQLSNRRMKVIQTKSDNNHNRKTIQQKKLKSLNLVPKQQVRISIQDDQYQLDMYNKDRWRQKKQDVEIQKNYKQCLRDDGSSSNGGQIVSHYRQSKSRYKNGKEKARRLIDKMLSSSKNNTDLIQNQFKEKIQKYKGQFETETANQYGIKQRELQKEKCTSTSGSKGFKEKVQKCSTLRFGTKESSNSSANRYSGPLSKFSNNSPNRRESNSSQQTFSTTKKSSFQLDTTDKKTNQNIPSSKNISKNDKNGSTNIISSQDVMQNPLVIKQRLAQYGFVDYDKLITNKQIQFKPVTMKQLNEQSQKKSKEVSRQMRLSRKQTQKLITRARQKNKKILGRLKQMKQKRSSFKKQLTCSGLKKSNGFNFKSSIKNSILNSRLQKSNRFTGQANELELLGVNSNLQSQSVAAFNQEIKQKILIHLETIKTIADYAQSFGNVYQDCNQWEDLIFLLYKKYYMERYKAYHILKTGRVMFKDGSEQNQSPFVFDFCSVNQQELQMFRQTKEQISLELQVQTDNDSIKSSLRDLYNKFIEKNAQNSSFNMYDIDDFSQQILQDLNQEINMLIQSCGKSSKIKKRINQAIQVGLLIAHIEGYVFEQIEDIAYGEVENREYFDKYYPKFLEIFENEESGG